MAEVARRWEVDPNTILRIREVGKQAALEVLANSRPGRLRNGEDPELPVAKAEIARLGEALKEMVSRSRSWRKRAALGVVGVVHRRVDAATNQTPLGLLKNAMA